MSCAASSWRCKSVTGLGFNGIKRPQLPARQVRQRGRAQCRQGRLRNGPHPLWPSRFAGNAWATPHPGMRRRKALTFCASSAPTIANRELKLTHFQGEQDGSRSQIQHFASLPDFATAGVKKQITSCRRVQAQPGLLQTSTIPAALASMAKAVLARARLPASREGSCDDQSRQAGEGDRRA